MRLTIDFDPSTGAASLTGPGVGASGSGVTPATATPGALTGALDAGAYSGIAPQAPPTGAPLQTTAPGMTAGTAAAPPAPHSDTFGLTEGFTPVETGMNGGAFKR